MPDQEMCGILNINKPSGLTSHDVVLRVRKITGQRKVGHAGTLDPMATGVLLLCLGQATRVSEHLMASDKVYRARIWLGVSTDTYDTDGQIVGQAETASITRAQVEEELSRLLGRQRQLPPIYSAIKHKGTPLYRFARRGQVVARQARTVEIRMITLTRWTPPELEVEVECSKGTYIRSLAHDVGQRLGCGAHLAGLTRIASGNFRLEQAITLEELEQAFSQGRAAGLLLPIDAALQAFPGVTVDQATEKKIASGQPVQLLQPAETVLCRAYAKDGQLVALLQYDGDGLWRPHKVFYQRINTNDENHP